LLQGVFIYTAYDGFLPLPTEYPLLINHPV
jgi:hypothetical protein